MPDAIEATIKLMESKSESITIRSSYNLSELALTLKKLPMKFQNMFRILRLFISKIIDKKLQIHGLNQLMIVMQKMIGTGNQNTI